MGDYSKIEWVGENGKSFNPWIGCEKVSAGCKHCYAERDTSNRVSTARGLPLWGPGSTRHRTSAANWKKPLAWNKRAKMSRETTEHLLRTEGRALPHERPRVFCASLADVFEGGRPELDTWRADLWRLIEQCDELDWLLLTKRPENVREMVPISWSGSNDFARTIGGWPRHVWLGTTVENQAMADERIPHLLRVPAAVRFLSVEPLLGPISLAGRIEHSKVACAAGALRAGMFPDELHKRGTSIDWVIIGGESGPSARPMHPDWVRSIRDECVAAGVPFFFKQWGEHDQAGRRVGKKAAGRILDGRTWDEVPNG